MKFCGPLYHHPAFREIVGDVLHPGGLEHTKAAILACGWPQGAKVADVGCGAGATLKLLKDLGYEPLGFDLDPILLAQAFQKSGAKTSLAPAHHLPLPDKSLAAVICECVLSLTPNPAEVLAEFWRVLQPGGDLLIGDLVLVDGADLERRDNEDCVAGAVWLANASGRLMAAGFSILNLQHSRGPVKRLAAQMLWAGLDVGCGAVSGRPDLRRNLSYALWSAKKQ